MAFIVSNHTDQQNDDWKACGFINIFLPRRDGSTAKLGSIRLLLKDAEHVELAKWLDGNDERLAKLAAAMQFSFNATGKEKAALAVFD